MTSDRIATEDYAQPKDADLSAIGALDSSTAGAIASDGSGWIKKTYAQFKTALGLVKADVGLGNVDNTSNATERAATATLTNKTLTSPAITTPTGIVKGDVGLGSVDNTADTAKPVSTAQQTALNLKANLASPTFTGTVTIPTGGSITAPTGLVKGDVGLGNVDNTSDATKNAAAVTLTNKTLTSPAITTPTGIVKGDVGLGNVDNTSNATERAATATLTNKTIGVSQLSGQVSVANGGTGQSTAAAARAVAGLNIEGLTTVADANYAALATDRLIAYTSLTAVRTVTLPAASAFAVGQLLTVVCAVAGLTAGSIAIARAGTDLINGAATSITIPGSFGSWTVLSDGVSNWYVVDSYAGTRKSAVSPTTNGQVLSLTGLSVTPTQTPASGVVHAGGAFAGLDFIATEYGNVTACLDTRSFGGTVGSETATPSGTQVGAWHNGGWGTTVAIDCATIYCRATQVFSDTQSGCAWDAYVTGNGTVLQVLAITIDQDKSLIGQGRVVSVSPTGGVGYATGAGGTVTQGTSRTTTVVLNKVCGTITLFTGTLAADTDVSFTLTNSAIAAGDVLVFNVVGGAAIKGGYSINAIAAAGSATITVHNHTPTITASEAPVIAFAVIKAVTA